MWTELHVPVIGKVNNFMNYVNKKSNRCKSKQIFIHCKTILNISGVTAQHSTAVQVDEYSIK